MVFNVILSQHDHTQHATRLTLVYKHRMHISEVRSSAIVSAEDTGNSHRRTKHAHCSHRRPGIMQFRPGTGERGHIQDSTQHASHATQKHMPHAAAARHSRAHAAASTRQPRHRPRRDRLERLETISSTIPDVEQHMCTQIPSQTATTLTCVSARTYNMCAYIYIYI